MKKATQDSVRWASAYLRAEKKRNDITTGKYDEIEEAIKQLEEDLGK